MARIKPFQAVRPSTEQVQKTASLPYDVFNKEEARAYVAQHPGTFLSIDRAETLLAEEVSPYDEAVYQKAADEYKRWKAEGKYIKEEVPAFYIYEQTMEGRSQTGIVALASVDEYLNDTIKKHENTRLEKEMDRIHHVDSMNAQTGPIFLTYKTKTSIQTMIYEWKKKQPLYDFVSEEGVTQKVWIINEQSDIERIISEFQSVEALYIADGHHRAASAVKVCQMRRKAASKIDENAEYNGFLSVIFPDEELQIFDYNRVVKDLCGHTVSEFIESLWTDFTVDGPFVEQIKPDKKGEIGMYLVNRWYKLTMKPHLFSDDPIAGLDVSILQNAVLSKLLNIEDPKTDARIDFVGGIRGLDELERRCQKDCKVAFAMYPTSMDELFAVADAGLLMPPKSTWFEPKLLSGIFVHELS